MICDITGDGPLEIVGIASLADTIAVDAGAAYVWRVGTFTGSLAPWATLAASTAVAGDQLGGWRIPP